MKVRVYSPYVPYPVTEGAFQVIHDQIRRLLEEGHEVELVVWKSNSDPKGSPVLGRTPGLKIISLIENQGLRRDHRSLRFLRSLISRLASPELLYYAPELDFRGRLGQADLGIYHYSFAYAWLKCGRTEKHTVVHFHNLESELFEQRAARNPVQLVNARKLWRHERALASLADELWFVSPLDQAHYEERHPGHGAGGYAKLKFVPPTFDPALMAARRARRQSSLDLPASQASQPYIAGIVGGLDFPPNQASVEWILREVCPLLARQNFKGSIEVVGRGAPDWLKELARPYPFVRFLGFVPDLEQWWAQIGVLLVPHLTGSGVRIKLLEALESGVPVIANSAAVERIAPEQSRQELLQVSDRPEDWAETLVKGCNSGVSFPDLHPDLQG